jgi:hypothetical protein
MNDAALFCLIFNFHCENDFPRLCEGDEGECEEEENYLKFIGHHFWALPRLLEGRKRLNDFFYQSPHYRNVRVLSSVTYTIVLFLISSAESVAEFSYQLYRCIAR